MLTKRHATTSLFAVASMFWLAGAKADGCTGSVTPDEPSTGTGTAVCAPGSHVETVCDPIPLGAGAANGTPIVAGSAPTPDPATCHDACVPDSACPPGTAEQWVCEAWPPPPGEGGASSYPPPGSGGFSPDPGNPPPPHPGEGGYSQGTAGAPHAPPCDPTLGNCMPEPTCYLQCVPVDPCGPGFHAEWQCGGGGAGGASPIPGGGEGGATLVSGEGGAASIPGEPGIPDGFPGCGGAAPEPPQNCDLVCAPNSICPDGSYETTVCEPGPLDPNGNPLPGVCYTQCMPICPEGTIGQTVCTDSPDPALPAICFTECIPIDVCPPGQIEQTVCDPTVPPPPQHGPHDLPPPPVDCYTTCVPAPECPPGQHQEFDCGDLNGSGGAAPSCVPICVPDVPCDPTLVCGQALSCVDGLLFPTTCGPQNCDAPLGPCGVPVPTPVRLGR